MPACETKPISFEAKQQQDPAYTGMLGPEFQKQREQEADRFGAFWQIFVKKGDNISCLTYPLPGITAAKARSMLQEALYPDRTPLSVNRYESDDGNLLFMSRSLAGVPGGVGGLIGRFLSVPEQALGIDNTSRFIELREGVRKEFDNGLAGEIYQSAQDSGGSRIFAFPYQKRKDGVFGLSRDGRESQLSKLAMKGYDEHRKMLEAKEELLMQEGDLVIISVDAGPTVSRCCALFFKEKLEDVLKSLGDVARLYTGISGGGGILKNVAESTCDSCKRELGKNHKCSEKK